MKFIKGTFIKNIILLSSGSLFAQFINFVSAPFMTRLFSVDEIGLFTYIISIAYLFAPVICLRYESAIVLEEDENNVYALVKVCLTICVFLSAIIGGCYFLYFFYYGRFDVIGYVCVIAFLLIVSGISLVLNSYNTREQRYEILTKVPVYRALANMVSMMFLGIYTHSANGLICSHTISQIVGLWDQGKKLFRDRFIVIGISLENMKDVVQKYKGFPLYSVPAIFFNNCAYLSMNFFIADLYGMKELAYYAVSYRILGVPLSVISYNIGNVFFERASKDYAETGSFSSIYQKTFLLLCVLCVPVIGGIYFIAPWFCELYFGQEWYIAGLYVQIMCIMYASRFIFAPLTAGIFVLKRNKVEMCCQLCFLLISLGIYFAAKLITMIDIKTFLLIDSIGFAIVYMLFGGVIYRLSKISFNKEM